MTVHSNDITWENRTVPIMKAILSCLYILLVRKHGCNCVTKSNAFHCTYTYQLAGIHEEGLQRYYQHLLHSLWSCLEREIGTEKGSLFMYRRIHQRETLTMVATKTVSTLVILYMQTLWASTEGKANTSGVSTGVSKASIWVTPGQQRPNIRD